MVYSSQNAAFSADKQTFFATAQPINSNNYLFAENLASRKNHTFLLQNKLALETEFDQMFAVLQKKKNGNRDHFWLYSYYCASLLEAYYTAYADKIKAERFAEIKRKIKERDLEQDKSKNSEERFIDSLRNQFNSSLKKLADSPNHISQIRDNAAFINMVRLYWVFCRITLIQGLQVAKQLELIDKLDVILGTHTDINKIIATLEAPNSFLNYFGVSLFLFRFIIDAGLLIKHTFFPSELEQGKSNIYQLDSLPDEQQLATYANNYIYISKGKGDFYYVPRRGKPELLEGITPEDKNRLKEDFFAKKKQTKQNFVEYNADSVRSIITAYTGHVPELTTALDRFKHEIYKRYANFSNDFVWATVNFLTNFNHISKIPGPVTGYLISAFLIFDFCLISIRCYMAKKEYLTKKAQYLKEREYYNTNTVLSETEKRTHIEMLDKQLIELEIDWKTKEATYYFAASAAALLFAGFSASLVISSPVLIFGAYFICQVAVAIYMSLDAYSQYKQKELYFEHAQLVDEHYETALKEYIQARDDFIFTMVKNTAMPLLIIGTLAVCLPAGIILSALYLGYEGLHAYNKHAGNQAKEQTALEAPDDTDTDADTVMALAVS